jgi:beta-glucosidase
MDWETDPTGIATLLLRLTDEYGARKLYVTENGSSCPDAIRPDGTVDDPERQDYLIRHLAACASAARKGAPLAGYFAWSLLDNFEWAYGRSRGTRRPPARQPGHQ